VERDDHAGVLRLLAKRNIDLGRARNRTACRLHALLAELVAGGMAHEITASSAQAMLDTVTPTNAIEAARHTLALDHLADLRRLDEQMADSRRRIKAAVAAAQTSVTDVFGVGPIVAAMVIGLQRRRASVPHRPPLRLPHRHRPHRGVLRRAGGAPAVEAGVSPAQPRHPHRRHHPDPLRHSEGRAYYDRKLAEGKTKKEAVRALKRRISDAVYRRLLDDQTGR